MAAPAPPSGTLMLTISGNRGIVGDSLTPQVVVKYVSAYGQLQKSKGHGNLIILGYDTRPAVEWIKVHLLQLELKFLISALFQHQLFNLLYKKRMQPEVLLLLLHITHKCGVVLNS